jgi:hypothetical protein
MTSRSERPRPCFYVIQNVSPRYEAEITISLSYPSGGCTGEFAICWLKLGNKITPRLEIYDDAWKLFTTIPKKLWPALAALDSQDPTPEQIKALLVEIGFKDMTDYRRARS